MSHMKREQLMEVQMQKQEFPDWRRRTDYILQIILQRSRKRSFKSNRKYGYDGRKDRICGVIYKRKL